MNTRTKIGVGTLIAVLSLGTVVTVAAAQGWTGPGMGRGAGMHGGNMTGAGPWWADGSGSATAGQGRGRMTGSGMAGAGMGGAGMGGAGMGGAGMVPAVPADAPAVTDALRTALQAAYDEEVLARTTYLAVIDKLGSVVPFSNIARSELMHLNAVKQVAANHGVTVVDHTPTVSSPATLQAACATGVSVEKADIALYDQYLPAVKAWTDVTQVFTHLRAASVNMHLPAFTACA